MRLSIALGFLLLLGAPRLSVAATEVPALPADLQAMIDAPLSPLRAKNPDGSQLLFFERSSTLPLAYLSTPSIGLAGEEIAIELGAKKRRRLLQNPVFFAIASRQQTPLRVPQNRNISAHAFSPDGRWLALAIDGTSSVDLWVVDTRNGQGHPVLGLSINDIFVDPLVWSRDSRELLVASRTHSPDAASDIDRPIIEEAEGVKVPSRTYPYLLRTKGDEAKFKSLARIQWQVLSFKDAGTDGRARPWGEAGLYTALDQSPNGKLWLVKRMIPPFSFAVPASLFARSVEVWEKGRVNRVLTMPLAEGVPPEGERKGPRDALWQADQPARLLWLEALDDGDPRKKVEERDRLLAWSAPFEGRPEELARWPERVGKIHFLVEHGKMLVRSFNPDTSVATLDLFIPASEKVKGTRRQLLHYDVKDDYNNPGRLVTIDDGLGQERVAQEGPWIFLAGDGKNREGEQPFLDRMHLDTRTKERLFSSDPHASFIEEFNSFYQNTSDKIILAREAPSSPPNLWLWDRSTQKREQLTQFEDAVPAMTAVEKRSLVFQRSDGLTMSGTLYMPSILKPGEKLPAIVWAYPAEYRNAAVAGQVRVSTKRYSRPAPLGVEWLVTRGYAVLDDASMPLIGDKETVNNTLVTQLVANAQAVVDALDGLGTIDKRRIAVGGHSYGAFMTANLLAHSQLFCAGVARSGAYNRSLTPFGFQSERRTFWEAKDFYMNVSPFYHAESIKTPLLLIHGKDDDNPGTTPLQTERMFHAMRGVGGTARMVMLPYEAHGYRSRENIFLVQAETLHWLERWCGGN